MPTYTLAILQTNILDALDGNSGFYPSAQTADCINECAKRINLLTGASPLISAIGGGTVANQLVYSVPAGVIIPMRVYYSGRELQKFSLAGLSQRHRDWAIDTNTVKGPVCRWAPIGVDQFVIHPIDSIGGATLEVFGVSSLPLLVNAGDVLQLEDQWGKLVIDCARVRVQLKVGGAVFANASKAAYSQWVRELKSKVDWAGFNWPAYWLIQKTELAEAKGAGKV